MPPKTNKHPTNHLNHQEPQSSPIDLGSSSTTSIYSADYLDEKKQDYDLN